MKRLLCFWYFGFRHDFTPWTWKSFGNKVIVFRWCQFCGKVEVRR